MRLHVLTKKYEAQIFLDTYSTIQFSASDFCGPMNVFENVFVLFGSED